MTEGCPQPQFERGSDPQTQETTSRENPSGARLFPEFHFFMLGMKSRLRTMPRSRPRVRATGRLRGSMGLSDRAFFYR